MLCFKEIKDKKARCRVQIFSLSYLFFGSRPFLSALLAALVRPSLINLCFHYQFIELCRVAPEMGHLWSRGPQHALPPPSGLWRRQISVGVIIQCQHSVMNHWHVSKAFAAVARHSRYLHHRLQRSEKKRVISGWSVDKTHVLLGVWSKDTMQAGDGHPNAFLQCWENSKNLRQIIKGTVLV